MSATTNISSGGIVSHSIKIGGNAIPDESRVFSIRIEKEVNHIARAKIILLDGDASTSTFKTSSSDTFVPGGQITIEVGYDTKTKLLFKGIICEQSIRIDKSIGSNLEVICYDASIKTTVGRQCKTYKDKTDSEIMSSILATYSGIEYNNKSTSSKWQQQVQYDVTDWDFILSRAQANGLIVTTINNKISIQKPDSDSTSVLTVEYGNNLFELHANLNAVNQLKTVKASSWDYSKQALIEGKTKNTYSGPGNLSTNTLSEVVGLSSFQLQTPAPLQKEDLTTWSAAQLVKSDYSKIQGQAKFQGTALVEPGTYLTFKGVGDRFNGDHLVSKVVHDISDGNWITESSIGLPDNKDRAPLDKIASPVSGLLPRVNGLFTATVKKIYEDPENQYRILVDIPLFDTSGEGLWARHSSFYASRNAGAFFMPEVDDEVVVGFLNEDPRFPIILGSLYSKPKIKPSEGLDPNEKNTTKAIVSKSGIEVVFDDDNQVLTIKTPNKNSVELNDKTQHIKILDEHSNSIVMSETGIALKSSKDISIASDQNVSIRGDQGVTITANTGDLDLRGLNIKQTADTEFSVNGGEIASVQAAGELTLKGAMVMIN